MKKILFLVLVLVGMSACELPVDPVKVFTTQSIALVGGVPTVSGHFTVLNGGPVQGVVVLSIAYKAGLEVARNRVVLTGNWSNSISYPFTINFPTLSALSDLDEYAVTASKN